MAMKSGRFRRFRRSEDGTITVEFVLWFPFYMMLIAIVVDATVLFMGKTELWNVASHASRLVALKQMTAAQAEAYAEGLATGGNVFDAKVTSDGTTVKTVVSQTFENGSGVGLIVQILPPGATMSAVAYYRIEPSI